MHNDWGRYNWRLVNNRWMNNRRWNLVHNNWGRYNWWLVNHRRVNYRCWCRSCRRMNNYRWVSNRRRNLVHNNWGLLMRKCRRLSRRYGRRHSVGDRDSRSPHRAKGYINRPLYDHGRYPGMNHIQGFRCSQGKVDNSGRHEGAPVIYPDGNLAHV